MTGGFFMDGLSARKRTFALRAGRFTGGCFRNEVVAIKAVMLQFILHGAAGIFCRGFDAGEGEGLLFVVVNETGACRIFAQRGLVEQAAHIVFVLQGRGQRIVVRYPCSGDEVIACNVQQRQFFRMV